MDAKIWARVKEIFSEVIELDPVLREKRLAEACGDDLQLRGEVEALLRSSDEVEGFIEEPAYAMADAIPPDIEPSANKQIGHYRIVREIGRGGMGTVFLATRDDGEFHQEAAIKIVSSAFLGRENLRRFRQERQILAELSHPNIARLLDGGVADDGLPFLVMEYVEGEPLVEFAEKRSLTVEERLRVFQQICRAVAYAHAKLIVHRDIKPSNILVTSDGEIKLLDFGLAKFLDLESGDITATNFRALTPAYASPEQLRGDPITTASDIYSLGVVLYELMTGSRPFDHDSIAFEKMVELVSDSEPEKPSSKVGRSSVRAEIGTDDKSAAVRRRSLQGDIDNIVLMAMRHEPERRYGSVEQLGNDIERHLNGLPISATEDTFGYRTSKFIRRHRTGIIAAAAVVLTLVAGIVATAWQARVARQESDKAQRINTFLRDMLGSAAPEARGADLKVKDALDEASRRVRIDFADEPDILADVLFTIGKTYASMDLNQQAEKELRDALDASLRANGETHKTTAASLAVLGISLAFQSKSVEGEEVSRRAVDICRRLYPKGHEDLGVALFALAANAIQNGNAKQAEPAAEEASTVIKEFLGENHGYYLATLTMLGLARENNGNSADAEALYRQAVRKGDDVESRYRIFVAQASAYLGRVLIAKGEYTDAEASLKRSESLYREVLGPSNTSIAFIKQMLGQIEFQQGNYSAAESDLRRSYEMFETAHAIEQPIAVTTISLLGQSLTRSGRAADGEQYLKRALDIRSRTLPKGNYLISVTESALGECLTVQGRFAEAEPLLTTSYEALRTGLGDTDQRTVDALNRLNKLRESGARVTQMR